MLFYTDVIEGKVIILTFEQETDIFSNTDINLFLLVEDSLWVAITLVYFYNLIIPISTKLLESPIFRHVGRDENVGMFPKLGSD